MNTRWGAGILALALIAGRATAGERDFTILHSEVLDSSVQVVPRTAAPGAPTGAASLSFLAYGRQFRLELEPNRRLLNRLPRAQKQAAERYELYRGQMPGVPGSWVRITRIGAELYGAIWDGHELYTIEPARAVAPLARTPLNPGSSLPVIYRLSDVQTTPGTHVCGLVNGWAPAQERASALSEYRQLVGELTALATGADLKQIEVGILGDSQFRTAESDPMGAALARTNIVDGIFTEQVGVLIVVPEVKIFTSSDNPFSTSKAEDLLDQLGNYRNNNSAARSRGLTHLFTGRDLNGDTVGIAYIASLCHPRYGAGLSESRHGVMDSALIAAHEIGHNFGAPHDGESGSACASTGQYYLMAPALNGSSTFSPCSLQQMAPIIQAASCVIRAQIADAAVSTPDNLTAYVDNSFDYAVDVSSIGLVAVENAAVTVIANYGNLLIESASVPDGTCSINAEGTVATCQLGSLAPETTRRIQLRVKPLSFSYSSSINVQLTASNDRSATNNSHTTQIQINARADLAVAVNPVGITAFVNEPMNFSATVTASGIEPIINGRLNINGTGSLNIVSATVEGGTCAVLSASISCTLGDLTPGSIRQLNVQLSGAAPGSYQPSVMTFANNDGNASNNRATVFLRLNPRSDVSLRISPGTSIPATVGEPFDFLLIATSEAPDAVNNVTVRSQPNPDVVVESASAEGFDCQVASGTFTCTAAVLAPGTSRTLTVRAHASRTGFLILGANATGDNDQVTDNNSVQLVMDVRYAIDAGLNIPSSVTANETRPFTLSTTISSLGRQTAHNVKLTATFPDSFTIADVRPGLGSCTVENKTVTCTVADMGAGATNNVFMDLRGDVPGEFTVNFTVSADNDALGANNSSAVLFTIRELVDISLTLDGPDVYNFLIDKPFDIAFKVMSGSRPVPQARFSMYRPPGLAISSVESEAGPCTVGSDTVNCDFGTLPANSNKRLTLHARMTVAGGAGSGASVSAPADVDSSNNFQSVQFGGLAPTDGSLGGTSSLTATATQSFNYTLTISAGSGADLWAPIVDVPLPSGLALVSVNSGMQCTGRTGGFTCEGGFLTAGGSTQISASLRADNTGTFSITATLNASNDINSGNNAYTTSVKVNSASNPSGGGGSGGGGGSLEWLSLFALGILTTRRMARRRDYGCDA